MRLEEIEKLCNDATLGPWTASDDLVLSPQYCVAETNEDDAKFIAASRELVPKLLAVAKAAKLAVNDDDLKYEDHSSNLDSLDRELEKLEK